MSEFYTKYLPGSHSGSLVWRSSFLLRTRHYSDNRKRGLKGDTSRNKLRGLVARGVESIQEWTYGRGSQVNEHYRARVYFSPRTRKRFARSR